MVEVRYHPTKGPTTPYTLTRGQLHRRLGALKRGLPRRVRQFGRGRVIAAWDALFGTDDVTVYQWPEYDRIFDDEDERDVCWFILAGSVDEWRNAIRAAVRGPGALVGEIPMLTTLPDSRGSRYGAEVRTRETVEAIPITRKALNAAVDAEPGLCRAMLEYVADHGAEYLNDHGQFDEAFDQYFPSNSGWLLPAPYSIANARMRIFFCKLPDETTETLHIPPGAQLYPGMPFYMLVLIDMEQIRSVYPDNARAFDYHEVSIFVPVKIPRLTLPRFHVPFMYPDNIMAIYLGREIFGLPKLRSSNFSDQLDDGSKRFLMRRGSVNVLEAHYYELPEKDSWRVLTTDPPEDFRDVLVQLSGALGNPFRGFGAQIATAASRASEPVVDVANAILKRLPPSVRSIRTTSWKRIFDPTTTLRGEIPWNPNQFEVDGLVETPFVISEISELKVLELVDGHIHSPKGLFPTAPIETIVPWGIEMGVKMTLEGGKVVVDYIGRERQIAEANIDRMSWVPPADDGPGLE